MENRVIVFCRGIQGSGKTTWAKKWVSEDPEHRIRFNNEDIRAMFGTYWTQELEENIVNDLKYTFLSDVIKFGYNVVIDNMNLDESQIKSMITTINLYNDFRGRSFNYKITYRDFKTPLRECIERDSKRKHPVGASTIMETFHKYKDVLGYEDQFVYYIEEFEEGYDCWGRNESSWEKMKGMIFSDLSEAYKRLDVIKKNYKGEYRIIDNIGTIYESE